MSKKFTFNVKFKDSIKGDYSSSLFHSGRKINDLPSSLRNFIVFLAENMAYDKLYIKIERKLEKNEN